MGFRSWKRIVSGCGALLIALGVAASVNAAEPGQVQWTFYQTLPTLSTAIMQNAAPVLGEPFWRRQRRQHPAPDQPERRRERQPGRGQGTNRLCDDLCFRCRPGNGRMLRLPA